MCSLQQALVYHNGTRLQVKVKPEIGKHRANEVESTKSYDDIAQNFFEGRIVAASNEKADQNGPDCPDGHPDEFDQDNTDGNGSLSPGRRKINLCCLHLPSFPV